MAYDMYTGKKISTCKSAEQQVRTITMTYMADNDIPNPKNLDVSLDIVYAAINDFGGMKKLAYWYAWEKEGLWWYLASRFGWLVTWYAIRKTALKLGMYGFKGLVA